MAPDNMTVSAVKGRQLYQVDPIPSYERISRAHQNLLDPEETALAVGGLKWMAPDGLGEGFNPFTFYADITQSDNGLLGMQGRFIQNPETGELEPPQHSKVFTA